MSQVKAFPHKAAGEPEAAQAAPAQPEAALLSLDAPRTVAFTTRTSAFVYHFRRITSEDWLRYFASVVHQVIQTKGARDTVFESESALLDLVDRTLTSVEGYGDTSKMKGWKNALPLHHRIAAGIALRSVGLSQAKSEAPVLCDLVEIQLDANFGVANGKTVAYGGLVHRFRHPGIEELKRFNFEAARTRVTGSAESGVTTYPSRHAVAMKIYDDLIAEVEGYSVGGAPLQGVDNIKREMDGAHKAEAALALFIAQDEIVIE